MRITGGIARGRRLRAPGHGSVRPTADKVRGAIFNILEARYEITGKRMLDLYAGSGALGLDALSRGASSVTFVDESRGSCEVTRENLERSGFGGRGEVRRLRLPRGLSRLEGSARFDGAFLDPPYRQGLCHETLGWLGESALLVDGAWVVAEHAKTEPLLERYGTLRLTNSRWYGSTAVSLYEKAGA